MGGLLKVKKIIEYLQTMYGERDVAIALFMTDDVEKALLKSGYKLSDGEKIDVLKNLDKSINGSHSLRRQLILDEVIKLKGAK